MKPAPLALATSVAFLLAGASTRGGDFTFSPFTSDADSGLHSGLSYTSAADFVGTGARVVNGVPFNETGLTGANYALGGTTNDFTGNASNVTGVSNELVSDFRFTGDGSGNASVILSNLTVGQSYVTSWYNVGFGGAGGRNVDITPSDTGTPFRFDQNYSGAGNGNILRYAFTATAPTITYSIDAVSDGDSFHHYAFTNAVANKALLTTPVITHASGAGPGFAPFAVRNNDLLQTSVAGVVSGGNFSIEGGGGVPALTNGAFVINGGNPADNSQLATGGDGAFVEFTLDLSVNALGYDISSIESFGGWNDSGRDRQLFKLSYSLVGSADFTFLGALDSNPAAGGEPSAVRGVFDTALTGVDGIRIDFFGGQENTYAGYGEFDVVGSPTVPEPGALGASLLAAAGLLARRRRASA